MGVTGEAWSAASEGVGAGCVALCFDIWDGASAALAAGAEVPMDAGSGASASALSATRAQ